MELLYSLWKSGTDGKKDVKRAMDCLLEDYTEPSGEKLPRVPVKSKQLYKRFAEYKEAMAQGQVPTVRQWGNRGCPPFLDEDDFRK
jgi:hypothetical protein